MITLKISLMARPKRRELRDEIGWMCQTMGLGRIDSISTSESIFEKLLEGVKEGKSIGGSELSQKLGVSRGSVLNLLNRMHSSGIVRREGRGYVLRSKSMLETVKELEVDVQQVFHRLEQIAREIDKKMGIEEW